MNRLFSGIIVLLFGWCIVSACHEDNNDIFADAQIHINGGDTLQIRQIQATVQLTNLSSGQVTSSSDFDGAVASVHLLRGAYQVSVQGLVRYVTPEGGERIRNFRAYSDYIDLASSGTPSVTLNLLFI